MHATLKPRTNIVLLGFNFLGLAAIRLMFPDLPMVTIAIGVLFEILCGIGQRIAIRERTPQLLAAADALQVRRAIRSTWPGAAAIGVFWAAAILLALAAVATASTPVESIANWMMGYLSLAATRELVTLTAIFELARRQSESPATSVDSQ